MRKFVAISSVLAVILSLFILSTFVGSTSPAVAADEAKAAGPTVVEEDMHEFMEYLFQPTYQRLSQQMAIKEKDRAVWKQIKSDSLILAEGGNLTMMRGGKDSPDWNKFCAEVRNHGGELYKAAKKKDTAAAQTHYLAMIEQCNACHKVHAGGEHMLKP
jgi:hypothetical protein